MKTCKVESCDKPARARGWCGSHWWRWRKLGDVYADVPLGSTKPFHFQPHPQAWTEQENYFILDNPEMTAAQVAETLGRTVWAVNAQRGQLNKREPTDFSMPKGRQFGEVWEVGSRTMLCKTCPLCGLLLDATWFGRSGKYKTYCRKCASEKEALRSSPAKSSNARSRSLQAITVAQASRRGFEYTDREIRIYAQPELSLFQMALATQRTLSGVKEARARYLPDDKRKVRLGDPVETAWVIQLAPEVAEKLAA